MRFPYLFLLLLIGLAVTAYVIWIESDWVTNWSVELGGGLFASLVILFLVDRTLERRREREQQRVRDVALSLMRTPLIRHLFLLGSWYKAALPDPHPDPDNLPSSFRDLLGDSHSFIAFALVIELLDFSKDSPARPTTNWFRWSSQAMGSLKLRLDRVIDKYAVFLEASLIEDLEGLVDSPIVDILIELGELSPPELESRLGHRAEYNILEDSFLNQAVREHVDILLRLLDYFNDRSPDPILAEWLLHSLWAEDFEPRFGSGRISMS